MNKSLSKQTVIFHWLTGILFIAVFVIGLQFEDMPRGPEKGELMGLHKSLGLIVLVVALSRLAWRMKEGAIASVAVLTRAQEIAAKSIHHFLLLVTLAMPISGAVMSVAGGRALELFGIELIAAGEKTEWLQSAASFVHVNAVNLIMVAFALHVLGALKHQLVDKDGTLSRMLGRSSSASK
ncbi:cytochrome b [Vibrio crassostreae]|nr:cytochrome b [Vibrio crassostreae]TCO00417.1 cytochrome b561 [Vibrio crassostreae]CAK2139616.1 superoxide oxidase [Vibrio crassostreae]CAK2144383.1 superoxide oxidase [Vibrio crassostreae]CAK2152840.1 superoxide oxidase [Vibrio crassostreae]CAK2951124.1 superoxide oxidase [Vibrio crassostreae]